MPEIAGSNGVPAEHGMVTAGDPLAQQMLRDLREASMLPHADDPDPVGTSRAFWTAIAEQLRRGGNATPRMASHAAYCIEACLRDPKHARRHLGLTRPVGGQPKIEHLVMLGREVQALEAQGITVKYERVDGETDDAMLRVAMRHGISRETVRRAYAYVKDNPPQLLPEFKPVDRKKPRKRRKRA